MKKVVSLVVVVGLGLLACTDAQRANWGSIGTPGTVVCYSGGKVIYDGASTGKITTVENSDGWEFKDAKTGKFVRVSGDCIVQN